MTRDNRLDTIKGILIILVVLGHMIGAYEKGMINYNSYEFIYMFYMPLFILVSGYLTNIKNNKYFVKSIFRVFKPLVVFQILSFICVAIFEIRNYYSMEIVNSPDVIASNYGISYKTIRFFLCPIISHFELPDNFIAICTYTGVIMVIITYILSIRIFRWIANPSFSNKLLHRMS